MTDYAEEQRNELEAIESIYPDSFTVVEATLKFTYVERYPDEPPLWEIHSQENLEEEDGEDVLALLQQQVGPARLRVRVQLQHFGRVMSPGSVPLRWAKRPGPRARTDQNRPEPTRTDPGQGDPAEENLGMVMIFTLVNAVQEKLNEIVDVMKNRREEEHQRREAEAEEAEKVLFQGTVVTIENFLMWKGRFELEMSELKRKEQKEEEQGVKIKLTAGNNVEVDESLFQDIEDLDLDEDDPDFDPLALGSDED
ncbi:RWD domain-containing protein 1 [Liparis tanakae]|uniref:RWD domain-containing protein 1 n=1 Tax=Liparis tanakae TaxID=230148 RepID=A0A4Z2ER77_9TELE|nr:RWD domain-containing protein 1 [Liparis tanakae]